MVLSAPPDPAAWARIRAVTGLDEDILHREYWAHRHAYDRGDLTGDAYWHKAAAGAGIALTPSQITELIAADTDLWSQLNPPMLEWAQRLQRAGIRTGILSNIGDAMSAGLLAKHDWIERLRPPHLVPRPQPRQTRASHLPPRRRRSPHTTRQHPLHRRPHRKHRSRTRRRHAGHPLHNSHRLRTGDARPRPRLPCYN